MQHLSSKLERLAAETGDCPSKTRAGDACDEFMLFKSHIAATLHEIRDSLMHRDGLLTKGASGTKATVQMSHSIRRQLRVARDAATRLSAMQRKEATRAGSKPKAVVAGQVMQRQEAVALVFKHLQECESLEKRRYHTNDFDARVELFAAGGLGATMGVGTSSRQAPSSSTELSDIESLEQLHVLKDKDLQIDAHLEAVSEGVAELKTIALVMRDEVKIQSGMVDEITNKVESVEKRLHNTNKHMKRSLARTRSADRFVIDFILLAVLLAIVGYIISMVA